MVATTLIFSESVWATSLLPSQPPAIAQTPTAPGTANGPGTAAIPGIMSSPGESFPQPLLNSGGQIDSAQMSPFCSNTNYNIAGNDSRTLDLGSSYQCLAGGLAAPPNPIRDRFGDDNSNQQAGQAAGKIIIERIPDNSEDYGRTH